MTAQHTQMAPPMDDRGLAARLARSVPPDSQVVLELCTPNGSVANRVRSANPTVRFAIVELSSAKPTAAADLAAQLGGARPVFDCLVVHDAIFSQRDPFALIAVAQSYLRPGAPVLIVFPRRRLHQLGGAGPFPAGRLQALLMQRCALRTDSASMVFPAGADQRSTEPDSDFSFLIVRAIAADVPLKRLLIQAVTLRPIGACNDTRIYLPHTFIASVPGVRILSSVNHTPRLSEHPPGEHRLVVLQRRIWTPNDIPAVKRLLQEGYLLVAEFDDHPSHWPEIAAHNHLTFQAVHAVQTSTNFLADELRPLNPEIEVFPNQIAALPPLRRFPVGDRVSLFFGAFNRDEDWRPLIEPLNRILTTRKGAVDVRVIHDRAFFDALETGDKTFTPTCGYEDYIRILGSCDIGLLPLNDTLFNRCKSDLKFIECAAHGVVALASPVVYGGVIADGETGFLFRSPEEFSCRLTQLMDDQEMRINIAKRTYDYIVHHRLLAQHFRRRLNWYQSLLIRKPELDARLYERIPSLRP